MKGSIALGRRNNLGFGETMAHYYLRRVADEFRDFSDVVQKETASRIRGFQIRYGMESQRQTFSVCLKIL
jgi:hypothetical protein